MLRANLLNNDPGMDFCWASEKRWGFHNIQYHMYSDIYDIHLSSFNSEFNYQINCIKLSFQGTAFNFSSIPKFKCLHNFVPTSPSLVFSCLNIIKPRAFPTLSRGGCPFTQIRSTGLPGYP